MRENTMHHENPRSESGALVAVHLLTKHDEQLYLRPDFRKLNRPAPSALQPNKNANVALRERERRDTCGDLQREIRASGSRFVSPARNFCPHAIARSNTTQHTCRRCASPSFWRAPRTCFFMVFGLMHNSRPNFLVRQAAANEFYQSSSRPVN